MRKEFLPVVDATHFCNLSDFVGFCPNLSQFVAGHSRSFNLFHVPRMARPCGSLCVGVPAGPPESLTLGLTVTSWLPPHYPKNWHATWPNYSNLTFTRPIETNTFVFFFSRTKAVFVFSIFSLFHCVSSSLWRRLRRRSMWQSGNIWKTPCVFSLCQSVCLSISVINLAPLCVAKVLSCLLLAESINIGQVGTLSLFFALMTNLRQLRLCGFARRRVLVSKRDSTAVVTADYPSVPILSIVCIVHGHRRMKKNKKDV